ncbi:MAG: tetratricopeptide repeat protein, partial [Tolypothrix sp. Co-bin9]|nr:tetratricopeptide repeat protein [Tolypothrix sp. Co-bin9]
MIADKTRTPFNIGEPIQLDGFKIHEVGALVKGLEEKVENPQAVMTEVLAWTGGQPFLTQRVCELLRSWDCQENIDSQSKIERIIKSKIIDNWETQDKQEHLKTIRDRMLTNEQIAVALLGLYQQILQQDKIAVDSSAEQMRLRLTGLVVEQQGNLRVYNKIYGNVFHITWVENELGKLRFYADNLKAWVESKYQDQSCLLRGKDLEKARVWADINSLSDADYRFLSASVDAELNQKVAKAEEKQNKALEEERKANQRTRIGAFVLGVFVIGAVAASVIAGKAIREQGLAISELGKVRKELKSVTDQMQSSLTALETAQANEKSANEKAQEAASNSKTVNADFQKVIKDLQQKKQDLAEKDQQLNIANEEGISAKKAAKTLKEQEKSAKHKLKTALTQLQLARSEVSQVTANARLEKSTLAQVKEKLRRKVVEYKQVEQSLLVKNIQYHKKNLLVTDKEQEIKSKEQLLQTIIDFMKQAAKINQPTRKFFEDYLLKFNDSITTRGISSQITESDKKLLDTIKDIIKGVPGEQAETLINIGLNYFESGEYAKALEYFQQSLITFKEVKDRNGEKIALNAIGLIYSNIGKYQQAISSYEQAIIISREMGDVAVQGSILSNLGAMYRNLGNNQRALDYYSEALTIFKKIGNKGGEGTTLNNIGVIYESRGDFIKALKYYHIAMIISKEIGNKSSEANILKNIGRAYYSLRDFQKALE